MTEENDNVLDETNKVSSSFETTTEINFASADLAQLNYISKIKDIADFYDEVFVDLDGFGGADPEWNTDYYTTEDAQNLLVWDEMITAVRLANSEGEDLETVYNKPIRVFEIGSGMGFSALHWLTLDEKIEVTSIDHSQENFVIQNMRKLETMYPDRLSFLNISSLEYDDEADTTEYDIACIDGSLDTFQEDLYLAERLGAKCIWVMNIDTQLTAGLNDMAVDHPAIAYDSPHNIQYKVSTINRGTTEDPQYDDVEEIAVHRTRVVNSSFLRMIKTEVPMDENGNPVNTEAELS